MMPKYETIFNIPDSATFEAFGRLDFGGTF